DDALRESVAPAAVLCRLRPRNATTLFNRKLHSDLTGKGWSISKLPFIASLDRFDPRPDGSDDNVFIELTGATDITPATQVDVAADSPLGDASAFAYASCASLRSKRPKPQGSGCS